MKNINIPKKVIWITCDHLRYDCVANNGNDTIHTPNIDFLSKNGVNFDNCFAQNPMCMPSRSSFMTGLYPQQTGVTSNGYELPKDFPHTVARCFKRGGYLTTQIGKLHFQCHEDCDLDPRGKNDYGFDRFYLAEEPGPYQDAYMNFLATEYPEYVETFRVPRSLAPNRGDVDDLKVLDAPWQASFSGWVCEQAKRHIGGFGGGGRGYVKKDFIHLGFYAPHPPLNPTVEMYEPYRNKEVKMPNFKVDGEALDKPDCIKNLFKNWENVKNEDMLEYRKLFYAMVTGVDLAIGELLDTLKKQGVLDDCLIIFSSDHGDHCGDHSLLMKNHSFYDELMHLPLIMFWPNGFGTEQRNIDGLVEMVDILPTILGLSNIDVPTVMSGNDYSEELLNSDLAFPSRDDVLAYHGEGYVMLRNKEYKYLRFGDDAEVLYDLGKDENEIVNCVNNPEYCDVLNMMRHKMLNRLAKASKTPLSQAFSF